MNYAAIKYLDVANGPGVRTSLFVSGCRHHCKGCFNKEAWDFTYGKEFTKETEDEIIQSLRNGLTILGGEPMEPENLAGLLPFVKRVRKEKPNISIWIFTGFTWEELWSRTGYIFDETKELLSQIDILVDGKFVADLKSKMLQFRGSSNQRIIDVKKSDKDKVVLWEKMRR